MRECIFCQIARGEGTTKILYQDEHAIVFPDIHPQAPTHLLVIPKMHLTSLNEAEEKDCKLLGHLLWVGISQARCIGLHETGFRTVINTGSQGGQTVYHLHVHILGGRWLTWPPG